MYCEKCFVRGVQQEFIDVIVVVAIAIDDVYIVSGSTISHDIVFFCILNDTSIAHKPTPDAAI